MFIVSVDNLSISNMNLFWANGLPDYFTHAVECENFENLTVDGLHENLTGKNNKEAATIYLHNGNTADVKGVTSSDKTKKLILKDKKD